MAVSSKHGDTVIKSTFRLLVRRILGSKPFVEIRAQTTIGPLMEREGVRFDDN